MKQLLFSLLFAAPMAFSQTVQRPEYIVITNNPSSFFVTADQPKLELPKLVFKDSDRATRRWNAYFARPVDLRDTHYDYRYAYQLDAFTVVNSIMQHAIFPEVKW